MVDFNGLKELVVHLVGGFLAGGTEFGSVKCLFDILEAAKAVTRSLDLQVLACFHEDLAPWLVGVSAIPPV